MPSRRDFLLASGTAAGGALLAGTPLAARRAAASATPRPSVAAVVPAAWQLRWSPDPARDGLPAFETIEDDRADSHPAGQPHIVVEGDHYRFTMHTVDRDTMTDRQRQEVTGMRTPAGGPFLEWHRGETWRIAYSMFIPPSLKATTTFTHIMQMKQPGTGTLPILTQSLRRHGSTPTIELNVENSDVVIGSTPLSPLQNKWIDVDFELTIGDSGSGAVHWVIRDGGTTAVDIRRTGLDTFLEDRVRPKWGIYRSLGDTSGSLQDCFMLLRDMRGLQQVGGATRYEAENATISRGVVEANHGGFSGAGFVNGDNVAGSFVEWTVTAAVTGNATLAIRYANGTGTNRPMDISVNGSVVSAGRAFTGTGSWDTWATSTLTVPLVAGSNTIRTTATTANGGPNLDYIDLS
jgi:carbohydrate binding protein with CBM35 domain